MVKAVWETLKMLEPLFNRLNRLPVVTPFAPMFIANRSPLAVVELAGDQSKFKSEPVPAVPVKPVEVVLISASVPEVNVLAGTESWNNLPVSIEVDEP